MLRNRHGTANGYRVDKCRCPACTKAHTDAHRAWSERATPPCPACGGPRSYRAYIEGAMFCQKCRFASIEAEHGTEARYKRCKCDACRKAATAARHRRRLADPVAYAAANQRAYQRKMAKRAAQKAAS